jgi:hypothetical protein
LDDVKALETESFELSEEQLDMVAGGKGGIYKGDGHVFIWW